MSKFILTVAIFVSCTGNCSCLHAQGSFVIKGTLPDAFNDTELVLAGENQSFRRLSVHPHDGKFSFSGVITDTFERVYLTLLKENTRIVSWSFFMGGHAMALEITGTGTNDINFENVPFVEEQRQYLLLLKPLRDSLQLVYNLRHAADRQAAARIDSLEQLYSSLHADYFAQKLAFLKTIPHSYYGLYLLNKDILNDPKADADILESVFLAFDAAVRKTILGRDIKMKIEKKKSLSIGKQLPDFSFISSNKGKHALSDFRKKSYVLLCFWSSGCMPCIKSIPLLKSIDSSYAAKGLQMVSVSVDTDESVWLKSLQTHQMSWLQTCDLSNYRGESEIAFLYGIQYMPQYFLLDKSGTLIYHNAQLNDSDDFKKLYEILESVME